MPTFISLDPQPSSFASPLPWHTLSAENPRQSLRTADLFRALCVHPEHRLHGVAYDDDPALASVPRYENESDENNGVGRAFALVIDDVRITFVEDANDGYRSMFDEVVLEWQGVVRNRFVPVDVLVQWSPEVRWGESVNGVSMDASLVELRCPYTGARVAHVGTSWGDEHYPHKVDMFSPKAMVETARRAEIRHLTEIAEATSMAKPTRSDHRVRL